MGFDPTVAADRTAANSIFSPANGSDLCVRVVQGGVTKTYMLAASWLINQDPKSSGSLVTEAINLPASGGAVTKIQLLLTPDAEDNGLPANPQVLSTWAPLTPEPAAFEAVPAAYGSSAVTMKAAAGAVAFGYTGTVEYLFTETTGNPGATSSGWQTSRSYTDTGLQAGTLYSYTVSMRAGTLTTTTSAAASATTLAFPATATATVNSTQQFSLVANLEGFQAVTGLGAFDAGTADKLVVVVSTEDKNNTGTGYVYDVRYNGKLMTKAIQEDAGSGNGAAAIFYLDNPGPKGTGTIEVSAELPNGGIGAAYALSNTMVGFAATNSRTGSAANSVSLTTAGQNSVVIAVLENSGNPNAAGTTPTATSPLMERSSGSWGSQWGSHASGFQEVASPSAITPTFATSTGSGYSINIAAAEFPAKPSTVQPLLPNVWTQTNGGAQNWTTALNWDDGVVPNPTNTTTMDFSTANILADTTLNLGANRTARIWKFGDTLGTQNWIVTAGNTMTLGGTTPTIQVDRNTTQLDNVVAGTAGLTKTGVGTLNLRGTNSYTGGTTLTGGTLQFAKTAAMPASGTVAVGTGTALTVNVGGTDEWTTATTGNGTMGGLLAGIGGQGAPVTYTGNTTIGFDTTNASTDQTYAGAIANIGTSLGLSKLGAGTLILTAANTYTGPTTISAGTLRLSGSGRLNGGSYAGAVFIAGDATLDYSGSSSQTLSGAITGGGNLKSTTNVDFIMTNKANDFGSFSIGNGRVFINNEAGALPSAAAVNITGGLLAFGSVTEVSDNPFTVGSGGGIVTRRSGGTTLSNVKLPGTGTVIFNNDDVNTGTLNITNDQIVDEYDPVTGELISTGAQILTGPLTIQVGGSRMTTTTASLGRVIFGGRITGLGSLNVTSSGNSGNTNGLFRSGVLTLTGSNDYAGGTTITTGTLALGDSDVIPATPLTIANAKLDAATFTDTVGTLAITGSATINLGAGATLAFADSSAISWGSGTLTLTGTFVSGSSLRFGNSATALTATQLAKIGSTVFSYFSLNADGYLIATLTGVPVYTITNNTTDVNGACTPTGVTSVGSGGSLTYTLTPNAGYAVATLTVNGVPVPPTLIYTFNNVSANQTISATFVSTTLYWDSDSTTPGFGGTTGTWGTTSFWSADASGSSAPIAIATDTDFSVNFGSATLNYNQAAVSVAAGGVNVGNITFGAGQSTPLTLSGGTITLGDTAVITVNNAANTIASVLAGAGSSLTKTGLGNLALAGNNTYSGKTIVSAGTLQLTGSGRLGNGSYAGALDIAAAASFVQGAAVTQTLSGVVGTGGGSVSMSTGGGELILTNGSNAYGALNISAGRVFIGATGALPAGASVALTGGTLDFNAAGSPTYSNAITVSSGSSNIAARQTTTLNNVTLPGTGFVTFNNDDAATSTLNITNNQALSGNLSVQVGGGNATIGNVTLSGNISGASGALTKLGAGRLILSGANNTYGGTTSIGAGTLAITNTSSLTGGLTFGATAGNTTFSALDLSAGNAACAGAFIVQTNTATPNTITIGAARALTLNGGMTLGYDAAGGSGATDSKLTASGLGSMAVNGATINISVNQAATNAGYFSRGTLDVSGLAAFSTNVTNFNIGVGNNTTGVGNVLLSNTANTILATTLQVGNTGGNNGSGTSTLTLGTGTNVIQADTINIGRNKSSGPGVVTFVSQTTGSPGTVTITDKAGTGRANIDIANQLTNGTSGAAVGTLDLRGHVATVSAGTVTIGASAANSNTGSPNGTLFFDAGTFDVNTLAMAPKSAAGTGTSNATLNVGGGAFTVNTAFALGTLASGGFSVATLNLTGGTFTSTPDITKTGAANTTSTINLDGGTLDMTSNAIGTLAQPIILNAKQGTLKNVAAINGTGGLTKTTAGTLVLSGTNTYTGPTVISSGTLALGANNALPATAVSIDSATLNAATFTDALGTLDVTGSAVINFGTGAVLSFANSNAIDWSDGAGGTLTLTGTFVSGASLRFGTDGSGLTTAQLARISKPGGGVVTLNASGFLIDAPAGSYAAWATTNASSTTPAQDQDNDGVSNAMEYVLGGNALTNDLSKLPAISPSGGNILFSFRRTQSSINVTTALTIETGSLLHTWPGNYIVGADTAGSSAGVTVLKGVPAGFDTVTLSVPQAPDLQKFVRLKVAITQ